MGVVGLLTMFMVSSRKFLLLGQTSRRIEYLHKSSREAVFLTPLLSCEKHSCDVIDGIEENDEVLFEPFILHFLSKNKCI